MTTRACCEDSGSRRASCARPGRSRRCGCSSPCVHPRVRRGTAAGRGADAAACGPGVGGGRGRGDVIQVVWSAWAKPLSEGNTAQKGLDKPLGFILEQSVGKLYWSNTREMIGMFGWLDTVTPMATTIFWLRRRRRARACWRSVSGSRRDRVGGRRDPRARVRRAGHDRDRPCEREQPGLARSLHVAVRRRDPAAGRVRVALARGNHAGDQAVRVVVGGRRSSSRRSSRSTRRSAGTRSACNGPVFLLAVGTPWSPPVPSWILVLATSR